MKKWLSERRFGIFAVSIWLIVLAAIMYLGLGSVSQATTEYIERMRLIEFFHLNGFRNVIYPDHTNDWIRIVATACCTTVLACGWTKGCYKIAEVIGIFGDEEKKPFRWL